MQKLLEVLSGSVTARENLETLQSAIAQFIEIEQNPERVAIGVSSYFVDMREGEVWFVAGGERIALSEILQMRSAVLDLKQRFLMPFTGGTDEDFENLTEHSKEGMPEDAIGGSIPGVGTIDDVEGLRSLLDLITSNIASNATAINTKLTASNTEPSESNWLEPSATSPQPWVKISNIWFSESFPVDFSPPSHSTGVLTLSKLIPPRIPRIRIESGYGQLRSNGTGSAATDYYTMRVRCWKRDGTSVDIINDNNQNQTFGTSKFFSYSTPINIDAVAYIEFRVERFGTASNINVTTAANIDLRYGR